VEVVGYACYGHQKNLGRGSKKGGNEDLDSFLIHIITLVFYQKGGETLGGTGEKEEVYTTIFWKFKKKTSYN